MTTTTTTTTTTMTTQSDANVTKRYAKRRRNIVKTSDDDDDDDDDNDDNDERKGEKVEQENCHDKDHREKAQHDRITEIDPLLPVLPISNSASDTHSTFPLTIPSTRATLLLSSTPYDVVCDHDSASKPDILAASSPDDVTAITNDVMIHNKVDMPTNTLTRKRTRSEQEDDMSPVCNSPTDDSDQQQQRQDQDIDCVEPPRKRVQVKEEQYENVAVVAASNNYQSHGCDYTFRLTLDDEAVIDSQIHTSFVDITTQNTPLSHEQIVVSLKRLELNYNRAIIRQLTLERAAPDRPLFVQYYYNGKLKHRGKWGSFLYKFTPYEIRTYSWLVEYAKDYGPNERMDYKDVCDTLCQLITTNANVVAFAEPHGVTSYDNCVAMRDTWLFKQARHTVTIIGEPTCTVIAHDDARTAPMIVDTQFMVHYLVKRFADLLPVTQDTILSKECRRHYHFLKAMNTLK